MRKTLTDDLMDKREVPEVVVVDKDTASRRKFVENMYGEQTGDGYDPSSFRQDYDSGFVPPPMQEAPPMQPVKEKGRGPAIAAAAVLMVFWIYLLFFLPITSAVPGDDMGIDRTVLTGREEVIADRPSTELTDEERTWIAEIVSLPDVQYQINRFTEHDDYTYKSIEPEDMPPLEFADLDYGGVYINRDSNGNVYWDVSGSYNNIDGTEHYYISIDNTGKMFKNTNVYNHDGKLLYEYSVNDTYATKWEVRYTHHGLISFISDVMKAAGDQD